MDSILSILNNVSEEERENYLKDMSKHQRSILLELETDKEKALNYDLNDLLFDFDIEFVQKLLDIEIGEYLKDNKGNNRRNGFINGVEVYLGDRLINFNRPRLRKEKGFDSVIIPKRVKYLNDITKDVLVLYSKNNSVNEIKEIIKRMLKIDISTGLISTMVQAISEEVLNWRNRTLEKVYFTVNIDCTYITIRDNKNLVSHKIPIYIAIGTRIDGHKEVVGMYLGNEDEKKNIIDEKYNVDIGESKTFWLTVFSDLKDRGIEDILFIVSDGLKGMDKAIESDFPNSVYQRCITHIDRDLKKYTNKNDCYEVMKDFKGLYTATTKELSEDNFKAFIEKYKDKKTLIKKAAEYYEYIKPLYNYPINIRKYIYTNNIVESTNSKVKRGFYGRGALPNVNSAINIIYVNLIDLEKKWSKKKVDNWDNIQSELYTLYEDRIRKYMN